MSTPPTERRKVFQSGDAWELVSPAISFVIGGVLLIVALHLARELIGNLVTAITLTHSAVATQAHIIRVEYGTEDRGERDVDVYDAQYSFTAPNGKEFSGWIQMPDNPLEDSTGRLETGVVQTGDTYIPDPTHPIPFAIEYDPANPNNSRAVVIGDKQLIPTTGQTVLVGLFVVLLAYGALYNFRVGWKAARPILFGSKT